MERKEDWDVIKVCAANKKLYVIAFFIASLGAIAFSFSIPKTYTSRASISIDSNDKNPLSKGTMFTDIESMLSSSESDVLTEPYIYIKVLESQTFINGLLKANVYRNGKEKMSFSEYLEKHYKSPWWSFLYEKNTPSELVKKNIKYELKLKTGIIIVQVCDQDMSIANCLVDTVLVHLNAFMTNYMISKAKDNLANKEKVKRNAAANYHDALNKYNIYANANTDLEESGAQIKLGALKDEVDRTFALYEKTVDGWQFAKMEVQRKRPTFFKIKNNTIAIQPSNPKWIPNLLIWIFYAFIITTWFVLYKKKFENKRKQRDI